ncbi:MAG: hypothetical protein S0880_21620 [Actinomycetota bacterium]|nr:hypothetical protein [Actinomycetota bacterium]
MAAPSRARAPASTAVPPRWWLVGVAAVVAAIALAGLGARATYGARTSADEPQYLLSATTLGEDLDLDISDELADERYLPYHEIRLDPQTFELDESGRQVSPHDPLLPALLALPMLVGGWAAAKVALAALAAATAALTGWLAHHRFGVGWRTAAVTTVACFAGLPLATYGTQVYPEMAAGLAVLVMVAGLTTPLDGRSDERAVLWSTLLTMAAIVALPWLAVKYVPVAAVGGLALLVRLRDRPRLVVWVVAGAAAAGVVYLGLHQWIYGGWTVYSTGDHFTETGEFSVVGTEVDVLGRTRRLIGLLVDRGFGIAAWSPVWFLLPVAVAAGVVRRAPDRWLLAAIVAVTWLNATYVALTMHGWWVPGRQLVVGLPAAAILLACWAEVSARRLGAIAGLGVLGLVNWLWLAFEATTDRRTLIVDFADTAAWPYRLLAPLLPDGLRASATDDVLLVVWAVVIVAATVLAVRRTGGNGDLDARTPSSAPDRVADRS